MDTERKNVQIDPQKVSDILSGIALPPEFKEIEVRYGPDHDGDASVSLLFKVRDGVQIADADIPRLSRFMSSVVGALYNGNVGGFVYHRLDIAA